MDTNPTLDFLLARRSRPAKMLSAPAPDRARLEVLLTAATRVPDHGKLEPWRLVVLGRAALDRLADQVGAHAAALGLDAEKSAKGVNQFRESPLCVAVIASPVASDKIPAIEQTLSVGAVCTSLVNAALADGWGACWLTGWPAYDADLMAQALGVSAPEWVAGFVHIGTCDTIPPERPRPDLGQKVTWALE
jgi:nitroreductase